MARITESYNDDRLLAQLQKLRPELNFGQRVHVSNVDADAGPYNGRPVISVTIDFPLSDEEWREVLDGSRETK